MLFLHNYFIKVRGLRPVLEDELDSIQFLQEIDCKINVIGTKRDFAPGKELLIYRIAQEAIHNITKHAKATKISISLNYESDIFTMSIEDNGVAEFKRQMQHYVNLII
jgi:signal transduction histidine kinase